MRIKQVIVIRKDLNMRKGKMIAQGAHASMAAILYMEGVVKKDECVSEWLKGLFTKIVVYVNSEEELTNLYATAYRKGLNCSRILDAGLTEFNGVPTLTAVAVGPNYIEDVDAITKDLPLL